MRNYEFCNHQKTLKAGWVEEMKEVWPFLWKANGKFLEELELGLFGKLVVECTRYSTVVPLTSSQVPTKVSKL